ncbi:Pollen_allerg_1 domain-containing protein/DPBB_1 domain-containing protein [Cephalotus follicularis]|uniref:Pollen_allerg_1 domain-containing protein/DPBB_1 domain-containing protein n=1 Tax=Cephalotus follicularis TaxID=3775 RepID=A0A1Q3CI80_CEPFO|nr:Pollen_allerg_1 domain-containing protein/DPBB_1 domain-containing protein [Cephalotus follicularis]
MGISLKYHFCLLCVMVLLIEICYSQDTFTCSRATYYGSPDCLGTPTGACGFGEYGRTVYDANVAGVSRLWRNGTGCGACYQVRCKVPQLCTDDGIVVVVTDYGEGDKTDFILSSRAYARLGRPNMALELYAYGVVDIEFRRTPCKYAANLVLKVHEHSNYPDYLAIILLYQAGQSDILAVEVWQEDCKEWRGMRRAYGAVWDMANPPRGPIQLRFLVSGNAGSTWVQPKNAISSNWKAGDTYDTAIQLE